MAGRPRGAHLLRGGLLDRPDVRANARHGGPAAPWLGVPDLGGRRRHDLVHAFRGDAGVRSRGAGPSRPGADDRFADHCGRRLARRLLDRGVAAGPGLRRDRRRHLRRRHLRNAFHRDGCLSRRRHRDLGLGLRRRRGALRGRLFRHRPDDPLLDEKRAQPDPARNRADRRRDRHAPFRRDDRHAHHAPRFQRDAARAAGDARARAGDRHGRARRDRGGRVRGPDRPPHQVGRDAQAAPYGDQRRADRPSEPRRLPTNWRTGQRRARRRNARSACARSTSTASRRSTTFMATRPATTCCTCWPSGCARQLGASDIVARLGGDEFVGDHEFRRPLPIAFPRRPPRRRPEAPPDFGPAHRRGSAPASASPSIRTTPPMPRRSLNNADLAMYRAKSEGSPAPCFYERSSTKRYASAAR